MEDCWGCGKPTDSGVCTGPHDIETVRERAAVHIQWPRGRQRGLASVSVAPGGNYVRPNRFKSWLLDMED